MNQSPEQDGQVEHPETAVVVVDVDNPLVPHQATNMMEHRQELITEYHDGADSLVEKLQRSGKNTAEQMVMALVDEIIQETDHLVGNELIAVENDDLSTTSQISAKRAEVIQMALKAVQTKLMFDKDRGLDVESPSMKVVFGYFMGKVSGVFEKLGYESEASDIFFRTLGESMDPWKRELKAELDDLSSL